MNKLSQRYLVFAVGLAVNSFGIAFITKSALGTSPISSVPYVLSLAFPGITFGMFTFVLNMGFILLQILLLRRRFPPVQLLQVAVNVVFSACIDVGMFLLSWFDPASPPSASGQSAAGLCHSGRRHLHRGGPGRDCGAGRGHGPDHCPGKRPGIRRDQGPL